MRYPDCFISLRVISVWFCVQCILEHGLGGVALEIPDCGFLKIGMLHVIHIPYTIHVSTNKKVLIRGSISARFAFLPETLLKEGY